MKHLFFAYAVFMFISVSSIGYGQESGNLLSRGESVFGIGIGFSDVFFKTGELRSISMTVPMFYEYGIADFEKLGTLGIGADIMGSWTKFSSKVSENNTIITITEFEVLTYFAPRFAYHYTLYQNKWEVYVGASAGCIMQNLLCKEYATRTSFRFMGRTFAGTRFFFGKNFGIYIEGGYPYYASAGLLIRF